MLNKIKPERKPLKTTAKDTEIKMKLGDVNEVSDISGGLGSWV